jgi:hypothetical protein
MQTVHDNARRRQEREQLEQRVAAVRDAVLRPLENSIRSVAIATLAERHDDAALRERVYEVERVKTLGNEHRYAPPKADRDVERSRLRTALMALDGPVQRLRQRLFGSPQTPFRDWDEAVKWIGSQCVDVVDVGTADRAYVRYVDAEDRPALAAVRIDSPLHQLGRHCTAWAEVIRINALDLQRLVLAGKKPTRIYCLLVEETTIIPPPLDVGLPFAAHIVKIEIDTRDITYRTFVEAFKRAREVLRIGRRKKTPRDASEAELRDLVTRLGGPSLTTWQRVVRELPRFHDCKPDAARKAYKRLIQKDRRVRRGQS